MRILVLLTDAFGGMGGIALHNRDLLGALCAHPECEEVVAVPRLKPLHCEPLPEKLRYVTGGINGKARYVLTVLRTIRKDPDYDLVICGHINLLPIAYAASRWIVAPLLLEIHGIDAWRPTRSTLSNYLAAKIDAFVSVSGVTKGKFLEWADVPGSRGYILPNAIRCERFGPGPKKPELLERYGFHGKTVLMTMGRLASNERYKGFDQVLDLLPELKEDIPDVAYLIVGDGSDRARLKQKAVSLGIADRVVFAGYIPEADKADHYRLADVYVMPGTGEGFGFVFLEAMACGIPVIASKVDGSREAVRNGQLGFLVDPASRNELKDAILSALKITPGVVPEGIGYFSFEAFKERLHAIVNQVVGRFNA